MLEKRWLRVSEAADLYGLHPKTVLALCRARKLAHTRIPSISGGRGQIRIDRIAIDRQLEERLTPAIEAPAKVDRRRRK